MKLENIEDVDTRLDLNWLFIGAVSVALVRFGAKWVFSWTLEVSCNKRCEHGFHKIKRMYYQLMFKKNESFTLCQKIIKTYNMKWKF